MNAEVDEIIHLMRQSRMDAIRKGLEEFHKAANGKNKPKALIAGTVLRGIRALFEQASATPTHK